MSAKQHVTGFQPMVQDNQDSWLKYLMWDKKEEPKGGTMQENIGNKGTT